jgi:hypothetical protein
MSPIFFFLLPSYMYNPSNDQEPSLVSSLEACEHHQVRWEASVAGRVTLSPNGGSLPVEGVDVSWALMNRDKTEVLKDGLAGPTDDSGAFEIEINELLDLGNNLRYPLLLSFAKRTTSGESDPIEHRFLCDGERTVCSTNSGNATLYLKHLDFETPYRAIDDTTVPFTGKVVVGGTAGDDAGDGCPIQRAKVCLKDKVATGEGSEICDETDSDGNFLIPAIIGTRVRVEINYNNHTFSPTEANLIKSEGYGAGILIEPGKSYTSNDFEDTTTAQLLVNVAGGECSLLMGTSTVEVGIVACGWTTLKTQVRKLVVTLMAHTLDLLCLTHFDKLNDRFCSKGDSPRLVRGASCLYRSTNHGRSGRIRQSRSDQEFFRK